MIQTAVLAADPQLTDKFALLAEASAELLRGASDVGTIANPYLHPRNIHPSNLPMYQPLFDGLPEPRTGLKSFVAGARAVATALFDREPSWHGDVIKGPVDILLVSHLLRPEQIDSGQDLYYGDLPAALERQGLRSAMVLVNHTGLPWASLAPRWKPLSIPRLVLDRTLTAWEELGNGFALARAARRLKRRSAGDTGMANVARHAVAHSRSGTARSALRIGMQIASLVRQTGARMLVMTYEGHAWERLSMMLARQAVQEVTCVGYSHAVLFPEPRAMIASLGTKLDPDYILTAGTITRDKLATMLNMPTVGLGVLGSVRRGTAVLAPNRPTRCLVLPEGLVSESLPLIAAAACAARLLPDVRFRVRLHPVLRREQVLAEAPSLRDLPSNIEWSIQGPLENDFSDCRWLLYRGTSAVFQGVEAGLRPFYLSLPGEHAPIDPLAELSAWKIVINSGAELASAMSASVESEVEQAELAVARRYCSAYFAPIDPSTLVDIARGARSLGAPRGNDRIA